MAQGMYIEGRKIRNFADIQKNYQYEVTFINAGSIIGAGSEDITLRARSFSIPQRGHEAIESNFGAMKQFFPGKPTFSNTTEIMFEETHSQFVQKFLYTWQQKIFDINSGHTNYAKKRGSEGTGTVATTGITGGICDTIKIVAYDNLGNELDNKYWFVNAWLQNVNEVPIDYSQAGDSVKFTATFQFDFFEFGTEPPKYDVNSVEGSNLGANAGIKE